MMTFDEAVCFQVGFTWRLAATIRALHGPSAQVVVSFMNIAVHSRPLKDFFVEDPSHV